LSAWLLKLIIIRLSLYRSLFKSIRFYYSYFICFKISLKTAVNSICLGTCSSFLLSASLSISGCKSSYSFFNRQELFEVFLKIFIFAFLLFFLSVCQGTLHVLRGAKVSSTFESHKLFLIFFENKFSPQI